MAADDVMGKISFQAPDEGTGTDAILVAAAIQAVSVGDFSSSSNATRLEFMTGNSEAAVSQMALSTAKLDMINTTTAPELRMGISDAIAGANEDYAKITVQGTNSAGTTFDAAQILFEHDTATAGNRQGAISFKTSAGAATPAEALRIDNAGRVTKPLQPAFIVQAGSAQSNIAVNSTVTIVFDSEIADVGANFASNTFTAPITGKYQMNVNTYFQQVQIDSAYYNLTLVTSNRTYYSIFNSAGMDAIGYTSIVINVLADMDAGDTAYVAVYIADGTAAADFQGDNGTFSGFLSV